MRRRGGKDSPRPRPGSALSTLSNSSLRAGVLAETTDNKRYTRDWVSTHSPTPGEMAEGSVVDPDDYLSRTRPPPDGVELFQNEDGNLVYFDEEGNLVEWEGDERTAGGDDAVSQTPTLYADDEGNYFTIDAEGNHVPYEADVGDAADDAPEEYQEPEVYQDDDGNYFTLDADGNAVPYEADDRGAEGEPEVFQDDDGNYFTMDADGHYVPYTASGDAEAEEAAAADDDEPELFQDDDGNYFTMDAEGNAVPYYEGAGEADAQEEAEEPELFQDDDGNYYTMDAEGNAVPYQAEAANADGDGEAEDEPELFQDDDGNYFTLDADGNAVPYVAGDAEMADAEAESNGEPEVFQDDDGNYFTMDADGNAVPYATGDAAMDDAGSEDPAAEPELFEDEEGNVFSVDADGNTVPHEADGEDVQDADAVEEAEEEPELFQDDDGNYFTMDADGNAVPYVAGGESTADDAPSVHQDEDGMDAESNAEQDAESAAPSVYEDEDGNRFTMDAEGNAVPVDSGGIDLSKVPEGIDLMRADDGRYYFYDDAGELQEYLGVESAAPSVEPSVVDENELARAEEESLASDHIEEDQFDEMFDADELPDDVRADAAVLANSDDEYSVPKRSRSRILSTNDDEDAEGSGESAQSPTPLAAAESEWLRDDDGLTAPHVAQALLSVERRPDQPTQFAYSRSAAASRATSRVGSPQSSRAGTAAPSPDPESHPMRAWLDSSEQSILETDKTIKDLEAAIGDAALTQSKLADDHVQSKRRIAELEYDLDVQSRRYFSWISLERQMIPPPLAPDVWKDGDIFAERSIAANAADIESTAKEFVEAREGVLSYRFHAKRQRQDSDKREEAYWELRRRRNVSHAQDLLTTLIQEVFGSKQELHDLLGQLTAWVKTEIRVATSLSVHYANKIDLLERKIRRRQGLLDELAKFLTRELSGRKTLPEPEVEPFRFDADVTADADVDTAQPGQLRKYIDEGMVWTREAQHKIDALDSVLVDYRKRVAETDSLAMEMETRLAAKESRLVLLQSQIEKQDAPYRASLTSFPAGTLRNYFAEIHFMGIYSGRPVAPETLAQAQGSEPPSSPLVAGKAGGVTFEARAAADNDAAPASPLGTLPGSALLAADDDDGTEIVEEEVEEELPVVDAPDLEPVDLPSDRPSNEPTAEGEPAAAPAAEQVEAEMKPAIDDAKPVPKLEPQLSKKELRAARREQFQREQEAKEEDAYKKRMTKQRSSVKEEQERLAAASLQAEGREPDPPVDASPRQSKRAARQAAAEAEKVAKEKEADEEKEEKETADDTRQVSFAEAQAGPAVVPPKATEETRRPPPAVPAQGTPESPRTHKVLVRRLVRRPVSKPLPDAKTLGKEMYVPGVADYIKRYAPVKLQVRECGKQAERKARRLEEIDLKYAQALSKVRAMQSLAERPRSAEDMNAVMETMQEAYDHKEELTRVLAQYFALLGDRVAALRRLLALISDEIVHRERERDRRGAIIAAMDECHADLIRVNKIEAKRRLHRRNGERAREDRALAEAKRSDTQVRLQDARAALAAARRQLDSQDTTYNSRSSELVIGIDDETLPDFASSLPPSTPRAQRPAHQTYDPYAPPSDAPPSPSMPTDFPSVNKTRAEVTRQRNVDGNTVHTYWRRELPDVRANEAACEANAELMESNDARVKVLEDKIAELQPRKRLDVAPKPSTEPELRRLLVYVRNKESAEAERAACEQELAALAESSAAALLDTLRRLEQSTELLGEESARREQVLQRLEDARKAALPTMRRRRQEQDELMERIRNVQTDAERRLRHLGGDESDESDDEASDAAADSDDGSHADLAEETDRVLADAADPRYTQSLRKWAMQRDAYNADDQFFKELARPSPRPTGNSTPPLYPLPERRRRPFSTLSTRTSAQLIQSRIVRARMDGGTDEDALASSMIEPLVTAEAREQATEMSRMLRTLPARRNVGRRSSASGTSVAKRSGSGAARKKLPEPPSFLGLNRSRKSPGMHLTGGRPLPSVLERKYGDGTSSSRSSSRQGLARPPASVSSFGGGDGRPISAISRRSSTRPPSSTGGLAATSRRRLFTPDSVRAGSPMERIEAYLAQRADDHARRLRAHDDVRLPPSSTPLQFHYRVHPHLRRGEADAQADEDGAFYGTRPGVGFDEAGDDEFFPGGDAAYPRTMDDLRTPTPMDGGSLMVALDHLDT